MPHRQKHPLFLLVDDSEDDAFFLERMLARGSIPCEVERARDGRSLMERLARCTGKSADSQDRPAVIFLDLKMPGMSGFDLLQWMHDKAFDPPFHVVILSGSDHDADVSRALKMGASTYLVKPATAEELRQCLKPWLQQLQADPSHGDAAAGGSADSSRRA